MKHLLLTLVLFLSTILANAQDDFSYVPSVGVYTGIINYEGDLKPNSFTFQHSNFFFSLYLHQPILPHIVWRLGGSIGKLEAADRYNRDYLKSRNLSFYTNIQELYSGFELSLFDIDNKRITPYVFVGGAMFHFNPYTYDKNGKKVYLQPLSTEGQGLADYPNRKPYQLTQFALTWAGGIKYKVNDYINVGVELNQRKTFTDYLDDVSSSYVDYNKLLQTKGAKAVELAYRGDELPNGSSYPHDGEQRGTPNEKDWYYFLGVHATFRVDFIKSSIENLFSGSGSAYYNKRCPSNF
ncbi:MAG: hypothetical protein C4330_08345 [Chitinophagaceae bacterium]